MKYDLIVIGSGAAGLTASIGGVKIGAKVLLVEREKKLGGDCTHYGCVPSKSLISLSKTSNNLDSILKKVRQNVKKVEKKSESFDKIKAFGIDLKIGEASFVDKNTIKVGNKKYKGKNIVVAAGSSAFVPNIEGLKDAKFVTNREIFNVKNIKSLSIIGGGPIGCELGEAFAKIGIKVNIVNRSNQLLGREDKDAAKLVEKNFIKKGINVLLNSNPKKVKKIKNKKVIILENGDEIKSDEILVATGRSPNLKNLNLDKVGIKYDKRGIFIDERCRTNIKNIYAIGDIARGPQFTHFANHQGRVALTNLLFKFPQKYSAKVLPRVTFTTLQIASIGELKGQELRKNYKDIDKAITDFNEEGFIKIFVDKKGYINGAVIVGKGAGEMISQISLAMKNNLKITAISDTIYPYPTYSYGLRECADLYRGLNYTPFKKELVKKIFRFGK